MGISQSLYSDLIVLPEDPQGGHAQGKTKVLVDNKITWLFENNKDNITAAADVGVIAMLLWNSKVSNT